MTRKKIYYFINIAVLMLSAVWYIYLFDDFSAFKSSLNTGSLAMICTAAVLVHIIKGFRLYFAMLGNEIETSVYIKQYCKAAVVRMILPFKAGELFQMYCYGHCIRNFFRSVVIVLLDRFFDTLALVTAMFVMAVSNSARISAAYILLPAFIVTAMFLYIIFPNIHRYWKSYLMHEKATPNRIRILKVLTYLNAVYTEIKQVISGKGLILYTLSLFSWLAEIGIMYSANKQIHSGTGSFISEYLNTALFGGSFTPLDQFIFVSIIMLISLYIILSIYTKLKKRPV